jgi:hypothetical protein
VVERVVVGDREPRVTTVEFDVVVDAPPEAVWDVISDPRRLPYWDRHIVRVEGVPAEGLREGMRYTTEMRLMLLRSTIDGEVLEWDPPHRAKIRLVGLLDATVTSTIEPLSRPQPARARDRLPLPRRRRRDRGSESGGSGARTWRSAGTLAQKRDIEDSFSGGANDPDADLILVDVALAILGGTCAEPARSADEVADHEAETRGHHDHV